MDKGKSCMRVGENEVVFKFPITPTPSSHCNNTWFYIGHTNLKVSHPL